MEDMQRTVAHIFKNKEHFFRKLDGQYFKKLSDIQGEKTREKYEEIFERFSDFFLKNFKFRTSFKLLTSFQGNFLFCFQPNRLRKPVPQHFTELFIFQPSGVFFPASYGAYFSSVFSKTIYTKDGSRCEKMPFRCL